MQPKEYDEIEGILHEYAPDWRKFFKDLVDSTKRGQTRTALVEDIRRLISTSRSAHIDRNPKKSAAYFALDQIKTILLVLVYLGRQGYLQGFLHSPLSYTHSILSEISPLVDDSIMGTIDTGFDNHYKSASVDKTPDQRRGEVGRLLLELLSGIPPTKKQKKGFLASAWTELQTHIPIDHRILVWEELKIPNGTSVATIGDLIEKFRKSKRNKDFKISNLHRKQGTYREYAHNIDEQLQLPAFQPDLILVDSILVAEYFAKGVFDPVNNYATGPRINYPSEKRLDELGQTTNGQIIALPITFNYHRAASAPDFSFAWIKEDLIESKFEGLISKGLGKQAKIWEDELGGIVEASTRIGIGYEDNSEHRIGEGYSHPYIPMQLGPGAHACYTTFAYLAGSSRLKDDSSFLKCRSPIGVSSSSVLTFSIWGEEALIDGLKTLLLTAYLYSPYVSLVLDQSRAAKLRDTERQHWFDPCLPIEAQSFDQGPGVTVFHKSPMKGRHDAYFTCLGGFCLALNSKCDTKLAATNLALAMRRKFAPNPRDDYYESVAPPHPKIPNESGSPRKSPFPENRAIRPHVPGWKLIEDGISDVVRRYIFCVMIFRDRLSISDGNLGADTDEVRTTLGKFTPTFREHLGEDSDDWIDECLLPLNYEAKLISKIIEECAAPLRTDKNGGTDTNDAPPSNHTLRERFIDQLSRSFAEDLDSEIRRRINSLGYKIEK